MPLTASLCFACLHWIHPRVKKVWTADSCISFFGFSLISSQKPAWFGPMLIVPLCVGGWSTSTVESAISQMHDDSNQGASLPHHCFQPYFQPYGSEYLPNTLHPFYIVCINPFEFFFYSYFGTLSISNMKRERAKQILANDIINVRKKLNWHEKLLSS